MPKPPTRPLIPPSPNGVRSLRLRFPEPLEREFQRSYLRNVRWTLGLIAAVLTPPVVYLVAADLLAGRHLVSFARFTLAIVLTSLLLLGLSTRENAERVWQPLLVLLLWAATYFSLNESLPAVRAGNAPPHLLIPLQNNPFMFLSALYIQMPCTAVFRLHFSWAALLQAGITGIGLGLFITRHPQVPVDIYFRGALLIGFVLSVSALFQERLARRAFLANHLLDEERAGEKRKREDTERMLRILSQAIGGVVHDLGNPLTSILTGSDVLKSFAESGDLDMDTLAEFSDIIGGGARMLNVLQRSLMDQTRVLEGKPIPVDQRPANLRSIMEEGARYQIPRFARDRQITLPDGDLEVSMDKVKMATVFMNLIGNALKYSDGEVRLEWRVHGETLLTVVMDQGTEGIGITHLQARQLFVAFGRLPSHENIEGTGLGLLSVQKIVEAHGGEIYIEGHEEGVPASPRYSTAQSEYPPMLSEGYRTAFVIACPCVCS